MNGIRKRIRRLLSRFPLLYELGAACKLIWLKLSYSGGDSLAAIKFIPFTEGLAVDIGANRGQSAVCLSRLKPKFKVMSFEPNTRCLPFLKLVKLMLGDSFSYKLYGLSDNDSNRVYYEPHVNSIAVAAEGTFCASNLENGVRERIGKYELKETKFPVRTLDELNLSPLFVKIDVQGGEVEVLRGASDTIRRCRPVVVVERNPDNEAGVICFLSDLGYIRINNEMAKSKGVDLGTDNLFIYSGTIPELSR